MCTCPREAVFHSKSIAPHLLESGSAFHFFFKTKTLLVCGTPSQTRFLASKTVVDLTEQCSCTDDLGEAEGRGTEQGKGGNAVVLI